MPNSYFSKVILFIFLAIIVFIICKSILPSRLFPESEHLQNNVLVDSMLINAMTDTINNQSQTLVSENKNNPENIDQGLDTATCCDNLKEFYSKLYKLETKKRQKIRIGFFGDSMNDGDFIVQDIRNHLQSKFGGYGVGFVGITSLSAKSRSSVIHRFSDNWFTQSFLTVRKPTMSFGIDGQVSSINDTTNSDYWIKYKAGKQLHSILLYHPTLFSGKSNNYKAEINVTEENKLTVTHSLNTKSLLDTTHLVNGNAQQLLIQFHTADSIPFYGINSDNGLGIHVDNFTIRGNSGLPLSILNEPLMNAFDKILHYDLIVLQYGTNVLNYKSTDYGWYGRRMNKVIAHLKRCFPNADFLIISIADKASKDDTEMKTDNAVEPLIKIQKSYATQSGAGFINLYTLMGGNGSMVQWVDKKWAGKDFTHFTISGSHQIANLIYQQIIKSYLNFKQKNNYKLN